MGNGPWGTSGSIKSVHTWTTSSKGTNSDLFLTWDLPPDSTTAFEMAAAALAGQARAEQGPLQLSTTEVAPIFELTNAAGKVIAGGMRYIKAKSPLPPEKVTVVLKYLNASPVKDGSPPSEFRGSASGEVPSGYRLIAYCREGDDQFEAVATESAGRFSFKWQPPTAKNFRGIGFLGANFSSDAVTLKVGEPLAVFAFKTDVAYEAALVLVPVDRPTVMSPQRIAAPPTGPTKTLYLAFDYFGPSPDHNINLKGLVDLANDESVTTTVRYNDGDWSFQRFSSSWDTEEKLARLHWPIPESFSIPFDLDPVVTAFFHHAPAIPIQLSTNGPLSLFTVTNALHQRITLGIAYSIAPATNSTAKLSNLAFRKTVGGFDLLCAAFLPPEMAIEAWSTYGGEYPTTVRVTRDMPGFGTMISWKHPADYGANEIGVQKPEPLFSPPFSERFTNSVVTLTTDALDVFAITNSADKTKVWRGFIKMIPVDQERAFSPATETPKPSTVDMGLSLTTGTPTKIFEFNSVTNASNYVVLRTEVPMPVGQSLTALIEDSSGNTTRAISGLTVLHTRDETNTSSSLMWHAPDGAATNWVDSALQQIKESVLGRQFKISEGQNIRVFKFQSARPGAEKFASFRFENKHPAHPIPPTTLNVRSVFPMSHGFILNFEGDVPDGCRLEALCNPRENGTEGRFESSYIHGTYHYHAMWTFEGMQTERLSEPLGTTLTNQVKELKRAPIRISAGESKTVFTIKTPSKEYRAILKLAAPNER
jgi:hypothetical protein